MGLLNQILQGIGGQSQNADKHNQLLDEAIGLINNPETGGLAGLLNRFKSESLGDIFSSWIGTGQNQAIQPDQIQQVLGPDKVQQIATKLDLPPEEVSQGLTKLLPEIVDKMTPQGSIPGGDSAGECISAIKKLFGG